MTLTSSSSTYEHAPLLIITSSLCTIAACWLGFKCLRYWRSIHEARGLPQVRQFIDYLSFAAVILRQKYTRDLWRHAPRLFAELKTPIFAFVTWNGVSVHINDATIFREVCVTKRKVYPKAVDLYDSLRIFGENIVTTKGEIWRRHRSAATAAFSEANNHLVFETTLSVVRKMMDSWHKKREKGRPIHDDKEEGENIKVEREGQQKQGEGGIWVEILHDITEMSLAIITSSAFGMQIDAFHGGEEGEGASRSIQKKEKDKGVGSDGKYKMSFTRCMEVVSRNTLPKVLLPSWAFYLPFFKLREIGTAFKEFDEHILDVIEASRREVEEKKSQRRLRNADAAAADNGDDTGTAARKSQNLLSLLVQATDASSSTSKAKINLRELLGNAFIFLLAGHETSAHALSFALTLLALHPGAQEALYQEVTRFVPNDRDAPTFEDLEKMVYCQGIMNETLRLFPPVVLIPKRAMETAEVTGSDGTRYRIPEGCTVTLHAYSLHRNPKHYPDPEDFRPQRWNPQASDYVAIDHFAFSPFSLGERSCIGRKFAQITILTSLAMLIKRYRLNVPEGVTREELLASKTTLTLHPANACELIFTPRGG